VPEARLDEARAVLERRGFQPYLGGADLGERWTHPAWMWSRGDDRVDLHHGLAGALAPPERIFTELSARTVGLRRGRSELAVLERRAAGVVLALHAAQHGVGEGQPLRDLELAVQRLDSSVWAEAGALAERLDATGAFAAGLRLVPGGAAVAPDSSPS